ncbi:hypothetical protein CYMTET_20603 [Cymbomonas tetramitiformis]|uniref:Uncharacterized protein n=1 Tax=Cymbomonas tetramitiformis TaxID=36881 RepID=A0AAE0L3Q3_9CHLO|nr:hypothetical protein CYMTET_20603 [Cymbomonas tetramitiformis]
MEGGLGLRWRWTSGMENERGRAKPATVETALLELEDALRSQWDEYLQESEGYGAGYLPLDLAGLTSVTTGSRSDNFSEGHLASDVGAVDSQLNSSPQIQQENPNWKPSLVPDWLTVPGKDFWVESDPFGPIDYFEREAQL